MVTKKEELEVLKEFEKEAEQEVKLPQKNTAQTKGIIAIIIGFIGLILPVPLSILTGVIAIPLGSIALKQDKKTIGAIAIFLGLLNLFFFFLSIQF